MRSFVFDLNIGPDDMRGYYTGQAKHVVARTHTGQTVQFAARHLQRHVTREGMRGTFRLTVDDQNNFVSLERVGGFVA